MKKFLALALMVVMVMTMKVSVFAGEAATAPLSYEHGMTMGDIMRHFEPEVYAGLSEEMRAAVNSQLVNVEDNKDNNEQNSDVLYERENGEQQVITYGNLVFNGENTKGDSERIFRAIDLKGVGLIFRGGGKRGGKVTYNAELFAEIPCPSIGVLVTLYDGESNKLVDSDTAIETAAKSCNVSGKFTGLEKKHKYKMVATGVLVPPAGYSYTGVVPATIKTKTK